MHDLERIQRWLQTVLMHPEGVAEGIASAAAREHLDVGPDEVEQVVTRSRTLTAMDRLAIYGTAYYARLLECLREEFPVLVHALGEELFDAFAVDYLQKYPSRSYTLNNLATSFPRYLAETRPEPDDGEGSLTGWPDFLIDLATLELTFSEVFDGPGVEGEQLLGTAQLQAVPAERWPETRLVSVPCLRLLSLRYPVHEYYASVRRKQDPPPPDPADTFLAVTRWDYVVRHYPLSRPEYEVLHALLAGWPVGDAIGLAAQSAATDLDQLAASLRDWFEAWAARGFFRTVELAGGGSPR
ncbi:MAG: DNA-binding domain-containing protein [Gemmataceae bacterium]|nr:DNA-binding domain-containing protein [Gemmataceae bacterium]